MHALPSPSPVSSSLFRGRSPAGWNATTAAGAASLLLALAGVAVAAPEYQWTHYLGNTKGAGYRDGSAAEARFTKITGMVYDPQGNLYLADGGNHTIRRLSSAGQVTTVAGRVREPGFVQGPGSEARFSSLTSLTRDAQGNLYAGDGLYIRKITPSGEVSVFAGNGQTAHTDGHRLSVPVRPVDMMFDLYGVLWFIHQEEETPFAFTLRAIDPAGNVSTQGNLYQSTRLAIDGAGRVTVITRSSSGTGEPYVWAAAGPSNNQLLFSTEYGFPQALASNPAGTVIYAGAGRTIFQGTLSSGQWTRTQFTSLNDGAEALTFDPSGTLIAAGATAVVKVGVFGSFVNPVIAGGHLPSSVQGYMPVKTGTFAGVYFASTGLAAKPGGGFYTIMRTPDYHTRGAYEIVPAAEAVQATSFGGPAEPDDLAVAPDGTVWMTFSGTDDSVYRYQNGATLVISPATFPEESGVGRGLAADAAGNAYVGSSSGGRIFKINAAGQPTLLAGQNPGGGGSGSPDGTGAAARFAGIKVLATDAAGNVYAGDAARVRKITPAGVVTTLATVHAEVTGITVDANGTVYVTDSGYTPGLPLTSRVLRISQDGAVTPIGGVTGQQGLEPGDSDHVLFRNAGSIAIGADGNLYVSDPSNLCIYRGADILTLSPVLSTPVPGAFTGAPLTVAYTLPEAPLSGSVKLVFAGQSQQRTLTLSGAAATAGTHTLTIDPSDPASAPGVAGITGGSTIPEGTYDLTLSTRDAAANAPATATAAGIVVSSATAWSYHLWRQLVLHDPAAPELGDADQDGLPNLLDYAVPASPSAPRDFPGIVSVYPYPEPDGSRLRMLLPRDPLRADVTVIVEAGSDLQDWTALATSTLGAPFSGPGYVSGETPGSGLKNVEIRDTETVAGRRFMRVRAVKP